jgi:hypothetical protein
MLTMLPSAVTRVQQQWLQPRDSRTLAIAAIEWPTVSLP